MKTKLLLSSVILATVFSCQSAAEIRQERVNACGNICKNYPDIKAMTFDEGGGSLLFLGGGYQKETCTCHRGGS